MPDSPLFRTVAHCFRTIVPVAVDLLHLAVLVAHSRRTLAAENLFLRKQLAPNRLTSSRIQWKRRSLGDVLERKGESLNRNMLLIDRLRQRAASSCSFAEAHHPDREAETVRGVCRATALCRRSSQHHSYYRCPCIPPLADTGKADGSCPLRRRLHARPRSCPGLYFALASAPKPP
jgi:hypothetical protein